MIKVIVSILNWNNAPSTIRCLQSVVNSRKPEGVAITIVVLDNGSDNSDWAILQKTLSYTECKLIREDKNIGFAAGHNIVIRKALTEQADYIWLLNNDAIVTHCTLTGLLDAISQAQDCAVVSPMIYAHHDENIVDFVGAIHDWSTLDARRAENEATAKRMLTNCPDEFFVYGTAPLFRVKIFDRVGLLDEKMFAYYEDDELCARIAKAGWTRRMAFAVKIQHVQHRSVLEDRPPYYFYLMTRNSLIFYLRHTPPEFRRWIRLRFFGRAMVKAAQLQKHGFSEKYQACLLGIRDGLQGKDGPPPLINVAPLWLRWVSKVFPYRFQQWLDRIPVH